MSAEMLSSAGLKNKQNPLSHTDPSWIQCTHFFHLLIFSILHSRAQGSRKSQGATPTSKVEGGKGVKNPTTIDDNCDGMVRGPLSISDFCTQACNATSKKEEKAKRYTKRSKSHRKESPKPPRERPKPRICSNNQTQENKIASQKQSHK